MIYYFTSCCDITKVFGVPNNSDPFVPWDNFTDTVGTSYGLVIGSYSGCVTYSGSSETVITNPPIPLKNVSSTPPIFIPYYCYECENYFPCYTPPVVAPPTIVGYQNECGIVTILPMSVVCEISNPSVWGLEDGEVSVSITGGTAPYTVTWLNDGNVSPALELVGIGSYTATTVDFYGDYTATTVCILDTPKICTYEASIVEFFLPSQTPTKTPTQTPTRTSAPAISPSQTPTMTRTPSPTPTRTVTPTRTPTPTITPSNTPPCQRPVGLTQYNLVAIYYRLNPPFALALNDFGTGGTYADACDAWNLINDQYGGILNGIVFSHYLSESTSIDVGSTVFDFYLSSTDCTKVPAGNYWLVPGPMSLIFPIFGGPMDIVTVNSSGVITAITSCPLI